MKTFLNLFLLLFILSNTVHSQRIRKSEPKIQNKVMAPSITINDNLSAQELIEDILINSTCANVSNFSVSGGNFTNSEKSYGAFDANGTSFPFQNGIIITNGKANSAINSRTSLADDGNNSWPGDNDLNQTLNIVSKNATVLEFDFVPLGNKISFEYIFASEEYQQNSTYPCTYSDGFAFLLKEVGTVNYENLALIPNSNIPVKVTTVHPNIPGAGGCSAQNEQYFDAFNPTNYPTVYDGQTVILKAEADVVPNQQYHIKLVIGDENDTSYDSAIFLAGGSFNLGKTIGGNRTIANGNPICNATSIDATDPNATAYQWFFNGTPIAGETNAKLEFTPPYDNTTQAGNYYVETSYGTTCTSKSNEIYIEFAEELNVNISTYTKCDDDDTQNGIAQFSQSDFIAIKNQLFTNLPNNYVINFYEEENATAPIAVPYTNTTANQQTIYAKISNLTNSCYPAFPIQLNINTFDDSPETQSLFLCQDIESVELIADNGYLSYSWNTNPVQNSQSITITDSGTYVVTLENSNHCLGTQTFHVLRSEIATITAIKTIDFSTNNGVEITVVGIGDYEFSLDGIHFQDDPLFNNLEAGEYTIYVKDKKGCGLITDIFYILDYPKIFTPNGDGYNDTWQIKNLEKRGLANSKIYIFDRYGKLLKQISSQGNGWNGTFDGNILPASDYWFVLEMPNGKIIKNHFSLKR